MDKHAVFKKFMPKLARIAVSYEALPHLQVELQQEMAIAIWQALGKFRGDSSTDTFMYRIAHNVAVSHVKNAIKHHADSEDMDVFAHHKSLSRETHTHVQVTKLMAAIRLLPVIDRQIITLALDGVKHRDIARITGLTENNIAVRVNRTKTALKKRLEPSVSA